ncbi:hypothetical protein CA85_30790 [Allorhodopirellula solitaria]|uniref:Uncharacterized protein n=1 Tax=Allorhodopirellula solitaria TaxID=2527987 RepID=A0A5C5XW45_9BACT|nr:hypothetical protein CA85_30790 [Allorhodopirellula solitaria]
MPASFMVNAFALGSFDLSVKALVRDGSRTRDRQGCSLMLYPLSYCDRCTFRTHPKT